MSPLIVPGICRFTVEGHYAGHTWANVFDMDIDTDLGASRNVNIRDQARILLEEYGDAFAINLSTTWGIDRVKYADLDAADGITGLETTGSEGTVAPYNGSAAGEGANPASAVLIRKSTASQRGRRRGRMYLCGFTEAAVAGDSLIPGYVTSFQTNANAFLAAINQSSRLPTFITGGSNYSSKLVVVHERSNEPSSANEVTSLQVDQLLATQRRRLRR